MKWAALALAAIMASPGFTQGAPVTAPAAQSDVSVLSGRVDMLTANMVRTVNGFAPDSIGAVSVPMPDLTPYARTADVGTAISTATSGLVKSVNGQTGTVTVPSAADVANAVSAGTAGLASTSSVNAALTPYAKTVDVTSAISTATSGLATASALSSGLAGEVTARNSAIGAAVAPLVKTVNGVAPDATGNAAIAVTQFVAGFTPSSPGLVANLLSSTPCTTALLGQYAVVSNLYSNVANANSNEVLRCGSTGALQYWRPQRSDLAATMQFTGGTLALTPLLTPPVLYLTGTTTTNGTITPSTVGAYPGEQFVIYQQGAIGSLVATSINGLVGSALTMLTGGNHTLTFSCNASAVCGWQGQ